MGLNKWTATKPFGAGSFHAIAYGNNEFVVVGPNWIVSSKDEGANWTDHTVRSGPDPAQFTKVYYSVAYGGGVFVAVGAARIRWDGSGLSTQISQTVGGSTKFLRAIAYGVVQLGATSPKGYGLFVAVGDAGSVLTSQDGLTWAASTTGIAATDEFKAIAFGNQRFVAADASGKVLTSPDGVTWTATPTPPTSALQRLTFGGNRFVGLDVSKKVVASLDGASWTSLSTGLAGLAAMVSIEYGFDTLAVAGPAGAIHTSPDGVAWATRVSGSIQHLGGIAYGRNRFVAVGAGGATTPGGPAGGDIVRSGEFPSADLSALTTSAGPLTPGFSPTVTAYGATASSGTATVTPTSEDPQATIRVRFNSGNEATVASGSASAPGQLAGYRGHTFFITVTAPAATKVYTVGVSRRVPTVLRLFAWLWPFG